MNAMGWCTDNTSPYARMCTCFSLRATLRTIHPMHLHWLKVFERSFVCFSKVIPSATMSLPGVLDFTPFPSCLYFVHCDTDTTDWNQTKPVRDSALGWTVWPSGRSECEHNKHTVASCVYALLVSTLITRRPRRVPSTMSTSPSSSARASLVSLAKTDLTKLPYQGRQLSTGRSDVFQQPIAGLSLLAWCCSIGATARVNVDSFSRCGAVFSSVPCPITSPSAGRPWR